MLKMTAEQQQQPQQQNSHYKSRGLVDSFTKTVSCRESSSTDENRWSPAGQLKQPWLKSTSSSTFHGSFVNANAVFWSAKNLPKDQKGSALHDAY